MQDKKTIISTHNHVVGMKELYLNASEKMEMDLRKANKRYKNMRMRKISFALFSKIVLMYFGLLLVEIIKKGTHFKMYQRLGYWLCVKTKCTRYNPKRVFFTKDKDGKVTRTVRDIKIYRNTNGFVPFV